jgi:hypothetical protein
MNGSALSGFARNNPRICDLKKRAVPSARVVKSPKRPQLAPLWGRFFGAGARPPWNLNCFEGISFERGSAMPTYRFEIADGIRLADPVGLECEGAQDAKTKADLIARQIAADVELAKARCVIVLDEDGQEIYKAAVKT